MQKAGFHTLEFIIISLLSIWVSKNDNIIKSIEAINAIIISLGAHPLSGEDAQILIKILIVIVISIFVGLVWSIIRAIIVRTINKNEISGAKEISVAITDYLLRYHRERYRELIYSTSFAGFSAVASDAGAIAATEMERHATIVRDALQELRRILNDSYGKANLGLTVMLPGHAKGDDVERLYIQFWDTPRDEEPTTFRKGGGFAKGEGYCGRAWEREKTVGGNKRMLRILPFRDGVYVETSDRQRFVKDFLSIPVKYNMAYRSIDDLDTKQLDNIILILNLDAERRWYFPFRSAKIRAFEKLFEPMLWVISLHTNFWKEARKKLSARPG